MAPKTKIKPQVCSGFHMRARAGKKNITAAAAPDSSGSKSNNSSFRHLLPMHNNTLKLLLSHLELQLLLLVLTTNQMP
jgi:hypothetical protein